MQRKNYLKEMTMYQVYVRNHTPEGTFNALIKDLKRIRELGVDILYLLPIHPIGEVARKGILGSPYAIKDYYGVNKELGTLADFQALVKAAHELGLKVMIDIVLHHTSPDAKLLKEHPEFYFYKDGKLGNKVGDWSDIVDLDYTNLNLWDYMLEMLTYWVEIGVDGFRADVAPMIPLDFWKFVRSKLDVKYPDLLWLSESVEPSFVTYLQTNGYIGHTDNEMYQAFDMLYDYDVYPDLKAYLHGEKPLNDYITAVKNQEKFYPKDYLKIRTIENHDIERIASLATNEIVLYNITAWSFFQNGVGFLYAGQEVKAVHRPSLFDKDLIELKINDAHFYEFIKKLINLKKHAIFSKYSRYEILNDGADNTIVAVRATDRKLMYGLFNFASQEVKVKVELADGHYQNLLGGNVEVHDGHIKLNEPVVIMINNN